MSRSTLTQEDFDVLAFAAGALLANPEMREASRALQKLAARQRALGNVPTESPQAVADKLGDPQLARRFGLDPVNQPWQRPNEDDERRAPMLADEIKFRVRSGSDENVFLATRVRTGTEGKTAYMVVWKTGERRVYRPEWVAMQLRLGRWMPTFADQTVGRE